MPAVDPDEIVVLANHGTMPLRCAVARAMLLGQAEREAAIIVRKGALSRSVLSFDHIQQLAAHWSQTTEQPALSEPDCGCQLDELRDGQTARAK
jgi:hypothetical protein